ncbi:hypothetical protein QL285_064313 [Trifolium repens]|nr:hypothetical protein QL285_064313 [Trifolium repens]
MKPYLLVIQVKKSKELQQMPSFIIGLTPSDEDKRNDNDSLSGSDQKQEQGTGKEQNQKKNEQKKGGESIASTSRGRKKRPQMEAQDSDEASSGDEHVKQDIGKKDLDADARLRHKMSVPKVLMLKEDDVHRVYELPTAGKKINTDLCPDGAIKRLRKELGLTGDYSPIVKVAELEKLLKTTEKPRTWVKGAICYIIHNILCPTNRGNVSLQYADILEDPAGVSSYNWCSHVLDYMKKGLQSPEVLNPLADFHFLMKLFDVWVNEVETFVAELYKQRKMKMPFEFITFTWDTPKVPTQIDSDNCGVFCMKFPAEWGGGEMQSFKGWSRLKKHGDKGKVARIMDLRVDICSAILSHPSNSIKDEVQKLATSYYEQLLQKLPSCSVRNH